MIDAQTAMPIVGLLIVTAFAAALATEEVKPRPVAPPPNLDETPMVYIGTHDLDCIGKSQCEVEAERAFALATELNDNADADIANRYLAYKHFTRAELLLSRAQIPLPDHMARLPEHRRSLETDLEDRFRRARVNFHNLSTRNMHARMAAELRKVKAYFPDYGARYHLWAVEQERDMRTRGTYPVTLEI